MSVVATRESVLTKSIESYFTFLQDADSADMAYEDVGDLSELDE
jgi:hypothetical protein